MTEREYRRELREKSRCTVCEMKIGHAHLLLGGHATCCNSGCINAAKHDGQVYRTASRRLREGGYSDGGYIDVR